MFQLYEQGDVVEFYFRHIAMGIPYEFKAPLLEATTSSNKSLYPQLCIIFAHIQLAVLYYYFFYFILILLWFCYGVILVLFCFIIIFYHLSLCDDTTYVFRSFGSHDLATQYADEARRYLLTSPFSNYYYYIIIIIIILLFYYLSIRYKLVIIYHSHITTRTATQILCCVTPETAATLMMMAFYLDWSGSQACYFVSLAGNIAKVIFCVLFVVLFLLLLHYFI
jgi:hypothetical protein